MKKLQPLEAIRKHCLQCEGGNVEAVCNCRHPTCPLYAYRLGKVLPKGMHRPTKTIRIFCVEECQHDKPSQVKDCQGNEASPPCPMFLFRMGTNPNIGKAKREQARRGAHVLHARGKTRNTSNTVAEEPFCAPQKLQTLLAYPYMGSQ